MSYQNRTQITENLPDMISRARALTCLTASAMRQEDRPDCWTMEALAQTLDAARGLLDEVLQVIPDMEVNREVRLRMLHD